MAKTIKFNLVCDQNPVRTIEDLQNNFSIEDVLAYYHNGLLERWLKVRGYNEELEQVNAITVTDDLNIIYELIDIFRVAADDCTVNESVFILKYLQARKEQLALYQKENFKKQRIIYDYAVGYRALVGDLLYYNDDIAAIKGAVKEMVTNYSWALALDHKALFNTLYEKDYMLVLMCMLMVDECRKYYLPVPAGKMVLDLSTYPHMALGFKKVKDSVISLCHTRQLPIEYEDETKRLVFTVSAYLNKKSAYDELCSKYSLTIKYEDENGKLTTPPFNEHGNSNTSDSQDKMILDTLRHFASSETWMKKALGDNLHRFAGETERYWKDLEPKGKKYMIISMEEGDYVRPSGKQGAELSSYEVKGKFPILDGVDYKSNNAAHALLYMEV